MSLLADAVALAVVPVLSTVVCVDVDTWVVSVGPSTVQYECEVMCRLHTSIFVAFAYGHCMLLHFECCPYLHVCRQYVCTVTICLYADYSQHAYVHVVTVRWHILSKYRYVRRVTIQSIV